MGLRKGFSLDNIQELLAQSGRRGLPLILVDVNILLYAEFTRSPFHDRARAWWDVQLSGAGTGMSLLDRSLRFPSDCH